MSITFYPDYEWTVKEIPCTMCGDRCDKGTEYNPHCDGIRREPDCPNINMANGNAYAMLALLGLPTDDCCGGVGVEDLPRVMRAIVGASNVSNRRAQITEAPSESGGPGTGQCRVINCGRSDGYVTRRLIDLMELVQHCQEKGCGFYWC